MAKQKGIIKLVGKVGDIVYYYDKLHGYLARKVTSVNAERIRTDAAFARVRENNAEFGQSAWAVRLLRAAFKSLFATVADTRMTSRLTQAVINVIKSDTVHEPGMRRIANGKIDLLQGFEFNKHAALESVVRTSYTTAVDRGNGTAGITITGFNASQMIHAPAGATHFRLTSAAAEIDFETGHYSLQQISTQEIAVNDTTLTSLTLENTITAHGTATIFLTLGIEFVQEVNGQFSTISNAGHNALGIVHTEPAIYQKPDTKDASPAATIVAHLYTKQRLPQRRRASRRMLCIHRIGSTVDASWAGKCQR